MSGFRSQETEYGLNKEFDRFKATLVWRNGFESYNRGFKVKVFADGKEIFESKIMEAGFVSQNIDLDVYLKDNLSFKIYSQEKKKGKYDDKNGNWIL